MDDKDIEWHFNDLRKMLGEIKADVTDILNHIDPSQERKATWDYIGR